MLKYFTHKVIYKNILSYEQNDYNFRLHHYSALFWDTLDEISLEASRSWHLSYNDSWESHLKKTQNGMNKAQVERMAAIL